MKATVKWNGGSSMVGINDKGQEIEMDWKTGPSPVHLLLKSVAGCTLVDVITGLKGRELSEMWIEISGNRREEFPRVFTDMMIEYHVRGNVPRKLLERLIEKSHTTYCTVSNMLVDVEKNWQLIMHED